jgi:hypothetical protein
MNRFLLAICLQILAAVVFAQDSAKTSSVSCTGYVDFYYQYDFDNPATKERPSFLYNYKRHNEFNINLALLKVSYSNKNVRANIGLMAGNYPQYNLSAEPSPVQHIYEANIGYAFSDKLSMDAGIMPSHIGFETAISQDNWNLSRSILAENTPYYETGIKLNYIPNEKWTTAFLILNGWQNIKETNSNKAIGSQVQCKPTDKWLLNSSTFIGSEKPDSVKQLRLFHNFYVTYAVSKKLNAAILFDAGAEKKINSSGFNNWLGAAFLLQYSMNSTFYSACRIEYYKDKRGVLVSTNLPGGFQTTGLAWNIDYMPVKNISIRAEAGYFHSANKIFIKNNVLKKNNFSLLGSVAVSF